MAIKEHNNAEFLKPILWSSNSLGLIFIDKYSVPLWVCNIAINLVVVYFSVNYIQTKIAANFDNCFKKNFCSDVVESVNRIIQPTGTLLLALFNCRDLKRQIILKTQSYLEHNKLPISWVHKYFVLIFISTYALITSFNLVVTPLVQLLLHFINSSGFLVTDILILTLCLAIQKSYENINDKLEAMVKLKYIDTELMNKIISQHWDLCKLINDVNEAFGIDLVIRMLYTVIRITMLLFTILEYHSADELGQYAMLVLIEHTFEVFMFAFKIFYTCYRGSQLTSEGKRTLIIIREINLKLALEERNRAAIKQSLDIFTIRVNCQDIQVSASGFVTINLQLIQSLVGLILTYWIVLVQFQGDQDTKKPVPNT